MIKSALVGLALLLWMPVEVLASTGVRINGKTLPYDIWHRALMPGETITFTVPKGATVTVDGAPVTSPWTAPKTPDTLEMVVTSASGEKLARVAVFVLEPSSRINADGYLNGYRIGRYPKDEPAGFIRYEEGDYNVRVSPSFTLGQFLCKQQPDHFPKYLLVSSANLMRLETLLASLRADGLTDAKSFFVMSGYRTPFYNTAIGSAKYSRHMYGDAADVYLDVAPADGVMDDINGDGEVTKADADFFYDYAARLFASSDEVEPGGLGSYKANAVHGPFVHVDGRGRAARWGR